MLEQNSIRGFDLAEALEPTVPRPEQVADVVGLAEYLEPTPSSSRAEVERFATEVSDAAHRDGGLLQEAQRLAQRRLLKGRCSRRVVSLLAAAQRRSQIDGRRRRISAEHLRDPLVVKVTGPLTAQVGQRLEEAVDAAVDSTPAAAVDLREVEAWTADGLESLPRCEDRGAHLGDAQDGQR